MQIAAEAERLLEGSNGGARSVILAISSTRETEFEQEDALYSAAVLPKVTLRVSCFPF